MKRNEYGNDTPFATFGSGTRIKILANDYKEQFTEQT